MFPVSFFSLLLPQTFRLWCVNRSFRCKWREKKWFFRLSFWRNWVYYLLWNVCLPVQNFSNNRSNNMAVLQCEFCNWKKGFWVGYSALLEKIYCHLPNMDGKLIRPSETTAANRANKWPLACMFPKTRDFHFKLVFELQFHWTVQTNLIWIVRSVDRGYPLPHTLQKLVIIPVCRRIWTAKLLWRYIEFHFRRPSCHEIMSNNNSNLTFVMCTLVRKSDIKTSFCFRLAMDSMKCFDYRSLHHDDFSYGF